MEFNVLIESEEFRRQVDYLYSRYSLVLGKALVYQCALIGLWEAYRNYDPMGGAQFWTYSRIRMKGEVQDECRRITYGARAERRPEKVSKFNFPELYEEDITEFLLFMGQTLNTLPPRSRDILWDYIAGGGGGYRETGEKFGIDKSAVCQHVRRFLKCLKN